MRREFHLSSRGVPSSPEDDVDRPKRSILKTNSPIVLVRVSRSRGKMRYSRLKTCSLKYSFFRLLEDFHGIFTRLTYRVSVHKRYTCPAIEAINRVENVSASPGNNCHQSRFYAVSYAIASIIIREVRLC